MSEYAGKAVEVVFFNVKQDDWIRQAIAKHLTDLERNGSMHCWNIQQIEPGKEPENEIQKHLEIAHLILILFSADFILTYDGNHCMDFCLQRYDEGARVIPIIARFCSWENTPFGKLKALPDEMIRTREGESTTRPLNVCRNRELALWEIAREIHKIIKKIADKLKTQSSSFPGEEPVHTSFPLNTSLRPSNVEAENRPGSQASNSLVEFIGQVNRDMQFMDTEENWERLSALFKNFPDMMSEFKAHMDITEEFFRRFRKKMEGQ
jgi:hypothetical protein